MPGLGGLGGGFGMFGFLLEFFWEGLWVYAWKSDVWVFCWG